MVQHFLQLFKRFFHLCLWRIWVDNVNHPLGALIMLFPKNPLSLPSCQILNQPYFTKKVTVKFFIFKSLIFKSLVGAILLFISLVTNEFTNAWLFKEYLFCLSFPVLKPKLYACPFRNTDHGCFPLVIVYFINLILTYSFYNIKINSFCLNSL